LRPCFAPGGIKDFHDMNPAQPTPITDPTACPDVVRILLSARASQHLSETGQSVFALVSRQRWPDDLSRWAIYLLPVPLALARAAEGVILGTHTARPIRKPATATTGANTTPPPA
jgi:hypothetical protein